MLTGNYYEILAVWLLEGFCTNRLDLPLWPKRRKLVVVIFTSQMILDFRRPFLGIARNIPSWFPFAYDTTHFDKPAQKPVSFGFTVRCFFFLLQTRFSVLWIARFLFKSTLPLDEDLELANSLKKARFQKRLRIAAPVFLVVGRQLRRLSFSPLCGVLLLEDDVATAQQQVQKLKTWHLWKDVNLKKKDIVLQRWIVKMQHLFCFCLCVFFFGTAVQWFLFVHGKVAYGADFLPSGLLDCALRDAFDVRCFLERQALLRRNFLLLSSNALDSATCLAALSEVEGRNTLKHHGILVVSSCQQEDGFFWKFILNIIYVHW